MLSFPFSPSIHWPNLGFVPGLHETLGSLVSEAFCVISKKGEKCFKNTHFYRIQLEEKKEREEQILIDSSLYR